MVLRLNWLLAALISLSTFVCFSQELQKRPQYRRQKIEFAGKAGSKVVEIEVAETPAEHAYGLMKVSSLSANDGMIFVFSNDEIREFWMKNTWIDLDIAYVDAKKTIFEILKMKAVTSEMQTNLPIYPSKRPARYAIEMNAGWFKKNKISVGDKIKFISGPTSKSKK